MIVEDHPLVRLGLQRMLEAEDGFVVVGEAADGEEAVLRAQELQPDVILMDINLPKKYGLQATREITRQNKDVGVIVLTAYHDDEQLFHSIKAGAKAYYPKEVSPEELLAAIREVSKGNYVVEDQVMSSPQLARWIQREFEELAIFGESPDQMFEPLTEREMEILRHVTQGYSNKEIARALNISRQTVKNHMSSILRKMAANDRTEAAVLALRRGWIRLQDTVREDD
ncbi:MAG TPA: response regulator transcription factor [Anaerolineae bacterium]|nr:response regulator transcription factor [Anaerolineae bacterium]